MKTMIDSIKIMKKKNDISDVISSHSVSISPSKSSLKLAIADNL